MVEQVLSQEEIDALLNSMGSGEIDLDVSKSGKEEAKPYDLTAQSGMLRNQFFILEEIYDKFSGFLQKDISSSLQTEIKVEFVSTEMVKFGEFMQAFSNPTGFNLFTMEPLIGLPILAIEPSLLFSLIDCMFGGSGKPISRIREFTIIEKRMMQKLSGSILENLQAAWEPVYPINARVKKIETKPDFLHTVASDDLVIVSTFLLKSEHFEGSIYFCISYLTLEPIKDKLSSRIFRDTTIANPWTPLLKELLKKTKATITAELGKNNNYTVRDLMHLQTGDVIMLSNSPQDPIVLTIESVPKYLGFPGLVKGNKAVQISALINQNGGINNGNQ